MKLVEVINQVLTGLKDLVTVEQTLWLIGNLTGDSQKNRDIILTKTCILSALEAIIKLPKMT